MCSVHLKGASLFNLIFFIQDWKINRIKTSSKTDHTGQALISPSLASLRRSDPLGEVHDGQVHPLQINSGSMYHRFRRNCCLCQCLSSKFEKEQLEDSQEKAASTVAKCVFRRTTGSPVFTLLHNAHLLPTPYSHNTICNVNWTHSFTNFRKRRLQTGTGGLNLPSNPS